VDAFFRSRAAEIAAEVIALGEGWMGFFSGIKDLEKDEKNLSFVYLPF